MANQKQMKRLKQNVAAWNIWRKAHPDIWPDLLGAALSRTDLTGSNLSRANLSEANLGGTDLSGADLSDADLSGAILRNANLSKAFLNHVDLSHADLSGANLSEADLFRVNLTGADLFGADLSKANLANAHLVNANLDGVTFHQTVFFRTLFAWEDLSKGKALGTACHKGRSMVDINTVTLPQDESTRLHFLRGVGWTSTQISLLPALLAPRPLQSHSLFISYAQEDEAIALQLSRDLQEQNVPCWLVPHESVPGNVFRERMDQSIHSQDKLLLLLSSQSVHSAWIRYEVELVLSREQRDSREFLFPICLDDAIFDGTAPWMQSLQARSHIGDFTHWQSDTAYQEAFSTLLRQFNVANSPTP